MFTPSPQPRTVAISAIALVGVGLVACQRPAHPAAPAAKAATPVSTPAAPVDTPEHPAIEPAALKILQTTSDQLSRATSLSFTAITTYEAFARTGQPLYYTTQSTVIVQHPDKLRVFTPGDGPASDFYYDGKSMTAFSPRENLVATSDAPPSMTEMLKAADDKASITFPFAPLLAPDPYANLSAGLTSAFVVGQSNVVGGTVTDIVAFTNKNVQGELWVGIDDGLPRMLRVVYRNDPTHLRYQMDFTHWTRNAALSPAMFHFNNSTGARAMEFAQPGKTPSGDGK